MNVIKTSCGAFYAIPIYKGTHMVLVDFLTVVCTSHNSLEISLAWGFDFVSPSNSVTHLSHPSLFGEAQVSSNIDVYVYLKIIIIVLHATSSSLLANSMRCRKSK